MSDPMGGFRFDPEWRISLLTAVLLPFLVLLGFWQLQRAEEKAALATTWELRRHQSPATLSEMNTRSAADMAYVPVEFTGRFLQDKYFLLDNRMHGGRFGYEVLAPFMLQGKDLAVLVNRGWIRGDPARLTLPEVQPVVGEVRIAGHIYVAPGRPFLLAEQILEARWPQRIQAVEMDKLSPVLKAETGTEVFPYPVRIDVAEPGALTVDWQVVNVSPAKHTGYAVQWFSMAAVLAIFYILRSSNLWQLMSGRTRNSK